MLLAKNFFMLFIDIMRISNDIQKHAVFRAGLTPQIRREISKLDTKALEREFAKINVECCLKDNKSLGGILAYTANLLEEGAKKYSLPTTYLPPSIYVYNNDELINATFDTSKVTGFCITDVDTVIKDQKPFDVSSVFLENQTDDIDIIDILAEVSSKIGLSASNHFIKYVMHELFHAIHLDLIFKREGYEGKSPFAKQLYWNPYIIYPKGLYTIDKLQRPIKSLSKRNKINKNLGSYASTSKAELFPEVMTKIFTDSINPDNLSLKSNPMDLLKDYPKFIQRFIKQEME